MFPMLLLFKDYVIIGIGITFTMYSKGKYQLSSVIGFALHFVILGFFLFFPDILMLVSCALLTL